MRTLKILHKAKATLDTYRQFIRLCALTHPKMSPFAARAANTRAVLKVLLCIREQSLSRGASQSAVRRR